MNEIIRKKRKELGLTQEEVAGRLGVSTPAVNKWEKGATYPDVTLLPALARLLNTDLNTLLCFRDGLSQQELAEIFKEASARLHRDGFAAGADFLMQKIREYPDCIALIHPAAMTLDGALLMLEVPAGEKQAFEEQITALYQRVAASGEEPFADGAAFLLVSRWMKRKRFDEAQKLLDTLPEPSDLDKRTLQASLFLQQHQPEQAAPLLERKVLRLAQEMVNLLLQLSAAALQEERPEDAAAVTQTARQAAALFGLGDYYAAMPAFELAAAQKNLPDSLSSLKTMLDAAAASQCFPSGPLFRHLYKETPLPSLSLAGMMLPPMLTELKQNEKYDFLRADPEFQRLLRQYRAEYPKKQ